MVGRLACEITGIELRKRVGDVLDVERHVQRDSPIALEPHQVQQLILRRTGAVVSRAQAGMEQRQAVAAYRDGHPFDARHTRLLELTSLGDPLLGRKIDTGESDDPPATLDRHRRREHAHDLVPRSASACDIELANR